MKKIDIADDIAAVEPKLRQRFDEIAKAAMCAADAVAQEVVRLATASVDRVVPASIFHDRKQRFAEIRIQARLDISPAAAKAAISSARCPKARLLAVVVSVIIASPPRVPLVEIALRRR